MKELDERAARMLLSALFEPGDADLGDLVEAHGAVETVGRLWDGDVPERLRPAGGPTVAYTHDPAWLADGLVGATERCDARVVIPGDPDWPTQVEDLQGLGDPADRHTRPPLCLWVRGSGNLAELTARAVTVTGARAATEYGKHLADDIAAGLAEASWTVVNGGALGIDRAALTGALARGGLSVAVLACGVDAPYPSANRSVFDLVTERGLLVSEWPPGTQVTRSRFWVRNRLVAALSVGTVVIEAAHRSGTRNTARHAAELGRVLMFTPGPVTSSMSAGVHQLARGPWAARLVTRAEEVIADLTVEPEASEPSNARSPLSEVQALLVEVLPRGYIVETDRIAAAADVPAKVAAEQLEHLHRSGWVDRIDGRWRLARSQAPITGPGPAAS